MNSNDLLLRKLLWLYFLLLIFEGALRKWVLPQFSEPLLIVRDPICLLALLLGAGHLANQRFALFFMAVGVVALPLAITVGHGNVYVALFGARIWLLHFPVLFLFGAVFNRDDVWKFAKVATAIAIPMVVLVALQANSPREHILNLGVGGEGSSVYRGWLGVFRASGTFSFTNGVVEFFCLSFALFLGYLIAGPRPIPKWMWAALCAFLVAIPTAMSRLLVFSYVASVAVTVFSTVFSGKYLKNVALALCAVPVVIIGMLNTPALENSVTAFSFRWQAATALEGQGEGIGGVVQNRILARNFLSPLQDFDRYTLFGAGTGAGSNVGAKLLTGGREFLLGEDTIRATIGELGLVLGLIVLSLRIIFCLSLGFKAFSEFVGGNPLPLIIGSVAIRLLFFGNLGQPTSLGFVIVSCGLMLAAFNPGPSDDPDGNEETAGQT